MKLTRRQLKRLIEQAAQQAALELSPEQLKKIEDAEEEEKTKIATDLKVPKDMVDKAVTKSKEEETNENVFSLFEAKVKEVSLKSVDKAIVSCLKKEGGAAGMGMLVDAVQSLETKTKKLPKQLSSKDKIKNYIKKHPAVLTHKYKDIILIKGLPKAKLQEALEKVGFFKKYSYGLDDVPNKTKAHDDIIGHT